jgi:copper transport protein
VHGDLALPGRRPRPEDSRPSLASPVTVSTGPGAMAVDSDAPAARRLRRAVSAEAVLGLAVLAATAWLVNAQPAKQAYAAPYSTQVRAGPDFVNIVVDPAKAGPLALHLYILSAEGSELDVPEVDATMANATAGISGLVVPLQDAGPGHFVAYGFVVPIRGTWVVTVDVRVDAIDEYRAQPITVHIR